MGSLFLNELGIICSMGADKDQVAKHLFSPSLPETLTVSDKYSAGRPCHVGSVNGELPDLAHLEKRWRGRNNQLVAAAAAQIQASIDSLIQRVGANRIAVVLGTSTSGVGESELAHAHKLEAAIWPDDFHYEQQEAGTTALFLSHILGVTGPCHVISTACSSSAKAMASGARLINAGLADAVIVGGADSLCAFTLAGFTALESISVETCNPFSANRKGINIGEGAALFIMSREPGPVQFLGWGESSDAHHMSAPEPSGAGAISALMQTLKRANLEPSQIDYINLHGTATRQNDAMEALVVNTVFGDNTPASSTKAMTGHALGAAGAIEAGLCWLSLVQNPDNILPAHWWDGESDASIAPIQLVKPGQKSVRPLQNIVSQSFAFGGSNAAICMGRAKAMQAGSAQIVPKKIITLDQVLPHRDTMRWLDRLLSHDGNTIIVEALIHESHVLAVDEGVPAWAGIEYMAQAIAAWAGCRALANNEPIKIGFLLGTRKYECKNEYFTVGQRLIIHAHCELFADNGLGMFSCKILDGDTEIASASLSVYEPPNGSEFLTSNPA